MLGIAASGLAATDAKEADLVGHRRRLDFERLGGRGAFLDQRRILLISIVDLRQCARNLRQAAGLLAARLRDFSDDFGGLGDGGHHFIERRTGFAGPISPISSCRSALGTSSSRLPPAICSRQSRNP